MGSNTYKPWYCEVKNKKMKLFIQPQQFAN